MYPVIEHELTENAFTARGDKKSVKKGTKVFAIKVGEHYFSFSYIYRESAELVASRLAAEADFDKVANVVDSVEETVVTKVSPASVRKG